ncbi:hypothetical protein CR513_14653 [Mucuna pruriens]|uniref:Uncharacterized protein n=1 Tax=Mucuna pruriens TaxID=157652 RepID=A0A371HGR2_MUCPR|nr:hypothetical protein CR513_14653 [Mucuna pruriens]
MPLLQDRATLAAKNINKVLNRRPHS